jgi:outer membrane protein
MKTCCRHLTVVALLIFISSFSDAQTVWTLQQCIDRALSYNIQIRESGLNNELNRFQVQQNTAAMFPSLNGSATQNYFFGRSIDPYTNVYTDQQVRSNSFSLSSNLTLFEGFQLQNSLKQSRLNYLSGQNDLRKVQNDISLNVVSSYLQVLYNAELLTYTEEQFNASKIQRDRMNRMYELGSVNKITYLQLEAQLASDEVLLVQAQSQLDQSILSLTQLLELDTVKNFSIVKPEVIIPEFSTTFTNVQEVYNSALNTQPEIKSAEYKVMSAEKGVSVAKGDMYPRLYAGASVSTSYSTSSRQLTDVLTGAPYSTLSGYTSNGDSVYLVTPNETPVFGKTPFRDQLDNNLGKSVGFTLQIPLFNGLSTRTNIKRAQNNLEMTRLNNELTRKTLYKSVQQAVADASSSFRKYTAGQKSVDALQETFKYSEQRLDLGLISTYDYLLAKNNLAKAQADYLQAKYDYIFRVKIIDFYMGKTLSF